MAIPVPFARLVELMLGEGAFPVAAPETIPEGWKPSWNVAPRALVPAIVADGTGGAEWRFPRWGLVPRWASDPTIGDRLINARGESVAGKPSFRDAWRMRRCLVPVAAFYEWKRIGTRREPWAFGRGGASGIDSLLWLGGLHESWKAPDGVEQATVAIVTTGANDVVAPIHDRMPVVVPDADRARWIGVGRWAGGDPPLDLLAPAAPGSIRCWRVSTLVNDARRDGPECLEPLADAKGGEPADSIFPGW